MSDAFEDRIRTHLADQASRVTTPPDPEGFMQRSAGRRRRGVVVGGVALAMALATGVLTGVNLAGGSTVSSSSGSTTSPGPTRSGASLAPGSGSPNQPAIAGQLRYTLLFTRTTSSGVTVRAFAVQGVVGGCDGPAACPPSGTVPGPVRCPDNAMCAQPMLSPHTSPTTQPAPSGGGAPGATATVPPDPTPSDPVSACGQMVIELSTDRAVATGTAPWPAATPPSADTVLVLGEGSFGSAEGAPASWVAIWAGAGVTSVHLASSTGGVVDSMAPVAGLAVLAQAGTSGLTGTNVVGVDQSGATVGVAPADQVPGGSTCAPSSSPTTTTTTTAPDPTTTTSDPTTTTTGPTSTSTTTDPTSTSTAPTPSTTTVGPDTAAPIRPRGAR